MNHSDDKEIYGLVQGEDLNDPLEVDKTGPKTSKKLVIIVIAVVVAVIVPTVFFSTSHNDAVNKQKAKEEQEKKRISEVSIPQSLEVVNQEVSQQQKAGEKLKSANNQAMQNPFNSNATPLPSPLTPAQIGEMQANTQKTAQEDESKKNTERQRLVEIAGSKILVINNGNKSPGPMQDANQIDGLISKLNSGDAGNAAIEKIKADTEKAIAGLNNVQVPQSADNAQHNEDSNKSWLKETSNASSESDAAKVIRPQRAVSKYTVFQGSLIPAILISGINSDLPGQISAQVSQNVYDGINGHVLLIPKGSRLVGEYNNSVKVGQARVMAAFTRLIYPSGASVQLGAMSASDGMGNSGFNGDVNNHFIRMFSASFLIAGLSAILQNNSPPNVTVVTSGGLGQPVQNAAGQVLVDTAHTVLDRNKTIQPTITVPGGTKFNIQVQKDMVLPPAITSDSPMY
jgi:type IV secretion system protein VirB10